MITAIVFSRARPMQLDLLLTSLERNAPGVFDVNVIWYKDDFSEGYTTCAEEHLDYNFIVEDDLTYQVCSLLRDDGLVTFFTDDDVLYRRFLGLELGDDEICFSLRLGLNTTFCYPHARQQKVPSKRGHRLRWNWMMADGDFGYPMSLDGHVFWAPDLFPVLGRFTTPNWLELMLMRAAPSIDKSWMVCSLESHLVGIPANRVNTDMPNRNGDFHPYSVQELNDRYMCGERIDLDALDFSDIRGAHQEMELLFA